MSEALAPPWQGASLLTGRRDEGAKVTQYPKSRGPAPTPESLVARLQRRDDSALEEFIRATQDSAYRLAFSILNDHGRCQDVLQEVYLTVYQKIEQLREPAAWRGWFSQVVVNRCRQELRGRRFDSLDDVPESQLPSCDGMAERVQQKMEVREALAQLAAHDQAVLTMREVLDLSYQEIADSLEVPVGTVRSRLFHARQRLLNLLSGRRGR